MTPATRAALIAAGLTAGAGVVVLGIALWGGSDRLTSEAEAAVKTQLSDPQSAQFTNVRIVGAKGNRTVCGMVNAKNRMGGYVGAVPFAYDEFARTQAVLHEAWQIGYHTEIFGRCGLKPAPF